MADTVVVVSQPVTRVVVTDETPRVVVSSAGTQGPPGLQGDTGAPGGTRFTYTQVVPASQWDIPHGLGYYPHVTLIGADGAAFIGRVVYVDLNNISIVLNNPRPGRAELI